MPQTRRTHRRLVATLVLPLLLAAGASASAQSDTAFTYQGQLERADAPYTGFADFRFSLWDAPTGGVPLGTPRVVSGLEIQDGLFTTPLDFGERQYGPGDFLQIEVRTPAWDGQGTPPAFTIFPVRTALTAAVHSLSTRGLEVDQFGNVATGGAPRASQFATVSDTSVVLLAESSSNAGTWFRLVNTAAPESKTWSAISSGPSAVADAAVAGRLLLGANVGGQPATPVLTITPSTVAVFPGPIANIPDGRVGLNTTDPQATLDVWGDLSVILGITAGGGVTSGGDISTRRGVTAGGGTPSGGNNRGYTFLGNGGDDDSGLFSLADGQVSLFADATERVRVDRRNLAIGAGFVPQSNVHIRHQAAGADWGIRIQSEAQSAFQTGMRVSNDGFFDMTNRINGFSGFARLTSSGVWTTVSDERAKEDIHHLDGALDRAMRLDPVAYRYKGTEAEEIGFTAQNVAAEFPSLVTTGDDLMTLNYSGLSTVAIAALQELKAEKDREIEGLRALVDRLSARLEALEATK